MFGLKECIELLNKQIGKIGSLKIRPSYNPKYQIWKQSTLEILKKCFNQKYVDMFDRSGPKAFSKSEEHRYKLFLENLAEKESLLKGFIEENIEFKNGSIVTVSRITNLENYDFHPEIKKVSDGLFKNGHYAQAVEEAFKRVIKEVKDIYKKKTGETLDGDKLMNKAFGCTGQTPIIKFNNLETDVDRDEQTGIMFLFKGIVGIRNKKTHDNVILSDPSRAIEYLGLGSLLVRLLENRIQ